MDTDLGKENEKPAFALLPDKLLEMLLRQTRLNEAAAKVSKQATLPI